jgi:hypothetical protein
LKKTKRVFDTSKVTDHHAIIPTGVIPQNLSDAERKVFDLVARRFIGVFLPDCKFSTTTVLGEVRSETSPNPSEGGEPDNTGGGESRIICYRSEKRAGIERMSALFSHDREIILKDYHLKILFISFIYFSVRPLTYFCAF